MSSLGDQIVASLRHKKVLIIDDAYDEAPGLPDIGDDPIRECREAIQDDKARAPLEKLLDRKFEPENLADLLAEEDVRVKLWKQRSAESDAKKLLSVLFAQAEQAVKRKQDSVAPLQQLLSNDLKLEVVPLGRKDIEPDGKLSHLYQDVRLYFVDYYLDTASKSDEAVDRGIQQIKTIYSQYGPGDKPIIVLMSTEKLTVAQQQRFRDGLDALGSHFCFVHKPQLADKVGMQIVLDSMQKNYKQACAIDQVLDTWGKSAKKSVDSCVSTLRALDISDYAFLDKYRLDDDRTHLGHYVLWLYGEYLNSVIETQPDINTVADALDAIPTGTLFPASLMPAKVLVQVYSGAVFTDFRPKPPRKKEKEPKDDAHLYRIMLGDIYRRVHPAGQIDEAYVVITPSCDLARATGTTKVTLLAGVLKLKANSPASDGGVPEFLTIDDKTYSASWDLTAPLVKTVKEVHDDCREGNWTRLTRLRPIYALHLQRQYASVLLRVGIPVATQWYHPLAAEVYEKGHKSAAVRIFECGDTDPLVWRITGKDENPPAIVFMEPFIEKLRTALKEKSAKPENKALADKLDELIKLRTPVELKKIQKEESIGPFGVILLRRYDAQETHTGPNPILIRVFPSDLIPPAEPGLVVEPVVKPPVV